MDSDDGRNKGIRKDDGKIIKGTMTEAPTKLRASSIPSKVENVVFNNHHKSAFGNSQTRFHTATASQLLTTPGPGNYNPSLLQGKVDSKKGYGNLASQTKSNRLGSQRNWNPGPGRYEATKPLYKVKNRSSAILSASLQARQLFKNELRATINNPGPGNYEERMFRTNSATGAAVFNSKNSRFINTERNIPGVGSYQWQKVKNRIKSLKFTSDTVATMLEEKSFHQKYYDKALGASVDTSKQVGPGKYNPSLMDTKKTFSIKDDLKGRFAEPKGVREQASTNRDIRVAETPTLTRTKSVNSHISVFKSKYKRYEFGEVESKIMGDPWRYSPGKTHKNSHLVNFSKKWL